MFCKKCGNQLSDDAEFCPNCGTQTGVSQAPVQQVIDPFPVQQPVAPAQPEPVAAPVQPVQQNIPTPPPVQQTVPPVIPVEAAQSTSAPKEDKKKKLIIAIVGGVVGLIILIVIIASVAGKGSSSDTEPVDNSYYEESVDNTNDTETEATQSSASGDFDSNDPFDEGTAEKEGSLVYHKYNNSKTYKDKTVILDGKEVTLPCTVQEFYDATGYNVSLPDNEVEANYEYFGVDLTKGEKKVNCDVINISSSPKAYKDCTIISVGAYYSDYSDNPKLELPCGLKLGDNATINGIVNNLGAPKHYVTENENKTYYSIEYEFEKGNNTYDGKLSITISDGKVSNFDVSVGH